MPEFKDLTGQKFGKWTVIKRIENYKTPKGNTYTQWLCRCECGSDERGVLANALLSGRSTSCGCSQREIASKTCKTNFTSHKDSKNRLYKIWANIKKRCLNEKASNYKNYGGRGISICNDWLEYESFKLWSLSNGYTDELTIDRIDVNGDYEPNNCRWVTHTVQANNRRNNTFYEIDGIKHTLAEWAKLYNLKYKSLYKQIKYNNRNLSEFIQL